MQDLIEHNKKWSEDNMANEKKKKAKKFIDKLPIAERKRIVTAIGNLPYGEDIKRLQGYENVLRLRVGTYRIIYTVDHGKLIVTVIDAGNRGQIYKRL